MNYIQKKQMLKDLKKRIMAFGLATTMITTMGGCGDKKENEKIENEKNQIGFFIKAEEEKYGIGLYEYIINTDGFESEKYFKTNQDNIRIAKLIDKKEYGTNFFTDMSKRFYLDNLVLVWPACYSQYTSKWLNHYNFDFELKVEKISELDRFNLGYEYTVIHSSITAKRDLILPDFVKSTLISNKKEINKGDNLSSIAIYYKDELIGYKQIGAGSECENVINSNVGDVNLALSTVEELSIISECKTVSYNELYEIEEKLNEENNQQKKLVK